MEFNGVWIYENNEHGRHGTLMISRGPEREDMLLVRRDPNELVFEVGWQEMRRG